MEHLTVAIRSDGCYAGAMAEVIAQRVLRNDNAAIIERVARGESFVVTRSGQPIAELRPMSSGQRRLVRKEDLRAAFEGVGPPIDAAAFRRDLDHGLDQDLW